MNEFTLTDPVFEQSIVDSGIVTNGLLLNYDFGNPKCYFQGQPNVRDLSGTDTAYFSGSVSVPSPPYDPSYGGRLMFDATSSYITSSKNFGNLTRYSADCWVQFYGLPIPNTYPAVISDGWATVVNYAIGFCWIGDNTQLGGGFYDGAWRLALYGTPTLNKWYYCCTTYDGAAVRLYVNGAAPIVANYVGTPSTNGLGYRIGVRWDNTDIISGSIASVKLYKRVLSAPEVLQNYNATKGRFGM